MGYAIRLLISFFFKSAIATIFTSCQLKEEVAKSDENVFGASCLERLNPSQYIDCHILSRVSQHNSSVKIDI